MKPSSVIFGLGIALPVASPSLSLALAGLVLSAQGVMSATRLCAQVLPPRACPGRGMTIAPVFSVHVAIHSEPPEIVIATLDSLRRQTWPVPDFEVIVIDNNTSDPALWRPVERYCASTGRPFRFFHRMNVRGAKAGALNIALRRSRPDATHVVTVDADYRVCRDFLRIAADALAATGADYLQFPQAYVAEDSAGRGVERELEEYFSFDARQADGAKAVLLTGTLSVVAKAAIEAAGGWSGSTATEDAELGVRLCARGFTGRYVDRVVGRGMLPLSLRDLERQRYRWASGNLRTLLLHGGGLVSGRGGLSASRRIAIGSQLAAWLNLSLIPAGLLIGSLLSREAHPALLALCGISLFVSLIENLARVSLHKGSLAMPGIAVPAMACRLALAPSAARATIDALFSRSQGFAVTSKAVHRRRALPLPVDQMVCFAFGLLVLPLAFAAGPPAVLGALVLLLPLPASLFTARDLGRYQLSVLRSAPEAIR